jgi:hypothetical protein
MRYKPTLVTIEGEEIGIAPIVAKAAGTVFKIGRRIADRIAQRVRDKRRAKAAKSTPIVEEQAATTQNFKEKTRGTKAGTFPVDKKNDKTVLYIVGAGVAVAALVLLNKKRK